MSLLLVEDDIHKSKQLADYLRSVYSTTPLSVTRSFLSGLRELIRLSPEAAVFDMTLPTYDVTDIEDGGRTRTYGGRDLLAEIQDHGLPTRAVILTQYETFGDSHDRRTLDQVAAELAVDFPAIFMGVVYYHPSRTDWKNRLLALLSPILSTPTGDV